MKEKFSIGLAAASFMSGAIAIDGNNIMLAIISIAGIIISLIAGGWITEVIGGDYE